MRENVAALFRDIPDLRADLLRAVADGDTVWMEWRLHGTRRDGTPFEFAGVNLFGVRDGGGINAQIERMTRG